MVAAKINTTPLYTHKYLRCFQTGMRNISNVNAQFFNDFSLQQSIQISCRFTSVANIRLQGHLFSIPLYLTPLLTDWIPKEVKSCLLTWLAVLYINNYSFRGLHLKRRLFLDEIATCILPVSNKRSCVLKQTCSF